MEVAEDSFQSVVVEVVQDSFEGATTVEELNLNKHAEQDKVQSRKTEESICCVTQDVFNEEEVSIIDLNKFPEDDYENDSFEEKENKKPVRSMLRIYLDRFY